ncbi:MAG: hypothetical protein H6581_20555 [Bacteroidia bacterium]|nr:hypothetical protein [Bacteroidia bacterium]
MNSNYSRFQKETPRTKGPEWANHHILQSRFFKLIHPPLEDFSTEIRIGRLVGGPDRLEWLAFHRAYQLGPKGLAHLIQIAEKDGLDAAYLALNEYQKRK